MEDLQLREPLIFELGRPGRGATTQRPPASAQGADVPATLRPALRCPMACRPVRRRAARRCPADTARAQRGAAGSVRK